MVRKLPLALALVLTVLFARQASAGVITPQDLNDFDLSNVFATAPPDTFDPDLGTMVNTVYLLPSGDYLYTHLVTPNNAQLGPAGAGLFHTGFPVGGFTGDAGWDFLDAPSSFFTLTLNGVNQLLWFPGDTWDFPVDVFFVSSNPPRLGSYFLYSSAVPPTISEATSYAPTPEPGSMMLLGSGLAALYGAGRRRRNQKGGATPKVS